MTIGNDIDVRRQALRDRFPIWRPYTLSDWLDSCVTAFGQNPFVITDDVTMTYRDVADQSCWLAAGLRTLGVCPGDRVGILMANYPEFVTVKFAIARTGAVAVPFNYLYRTEELAHVLADSGCSVLVAMTEHGGLDYQSMLDSIAPGWDEPGFADRAHGDGAAPALRHVVLLRTGRPLRPGTMSVSDLTYLECTDDDVRPSRLNPHGPGDMLYTSGTTGSPKGVLVSHDGVLRTAYASALTRAYEDGRRILYSLPCYHMFGYVEGLLSVMYVGGAVVLQPTFSAEGYFRGIEKHCATDILCVPTMAVALLESPNRANYDLSTLTAILCGSAPAPVWLWQQIERELGVSEIVTGYGMTECGGAMTLTLPEDPLELTSETVGRPKLAGAAGIAGTDALTTYRVVSRDDGGAVPSGAEGELVSTGPTTMLGYWNQVGETERAIREGWLHSGDLGRIRTDGYLQLAGRSKELYKSGGELVMPKEIEDMLAGHEGISQVFAVGLRDDRWGEIGCVVVVPTPGSVITEEDVFAICRARLARFKVPKRVVFCRAEDLPTTPTGKVQKYRLVEVLSAASPKQVTQA
ncbi:class I adenylate-forming enzyme family protein [Mycobacteroides franklinii]|uniref:Long-chain fatty acid--CoA ligase n=1 Tax=Mycobacteroides franklinii TaxID=948102 RepID=A0A4R8RCT2_9MYCO|nr:class I adenylate-forming enzyme family protein [Mycobacteroides franklinii]ORA62979.1 acyl--CoA ligase [Mycobacteroides franklinii]TDH22387.1 long-chain fatty acid--CoA ligase [Mycobacteroides franklinii]TDZ44013.1 Long-chain-fatty-acid--CoA ligase FadD13 [Mycobacteroides franklinii]TDZ51147.1 Long-chain-fatty-acid--CoA ligase FadD13 [Mycobacteroides franklinii]TDZ57567.1 Long-chain-fatty-acid--CoA ligase FadD13 [Mycobacteroides franklinii]